MIRFFYVSKKCFCEHFVTLRAVFTSMGPLRALCRSMPVRGAVTEKKTCSVRLPYKQTQGEGEK